MKLYLKLYLSNGAETPGGDLLGVELDGVLGEVEPLLHNGGQLTDSGQKVGLVINLKY